MNRAVFGYDFLNNIFHFNFSKNYNFIKILSADFFCSFISVLIVFSSVFRVSPSNLLKAFFLRIIFLLFVPFLGVLFFWVALADMLVLDFGLRDLTFFIFLISESFKSSDIFSNAKLPYLTTFVGQL